MNAQTPSHLTPEQVPHGRGAWQRASVKAVVLGMAVLVMVALVGCLIIRTNAPPPPLQSDARTLYLATSPQELDVRSFTRKWHWQEREMQGADFFVAPYALADENIEVDAQIKAPEDDFLNAGGYGVFVGLDAHNTGYVCYAAGGTGEGMLIDHYPGWDQRTLTGETPSTDDVDFAHDVTVTLTVQKNVLTLFFDRKQVAQASATAYPTNGVVGIFAASNAWIRSFRIEKR